MSRWRARGLGLALGVCAAAVACGDGEEDAGGTPVVWELSPDHGAAGASVDVVGRHFCGEFAVNDGVCDPPVLGVVTFAVAGEGGAVGRAGVKSWKNKGLSVTVPAGLPAGPVEVWVSVNGVASNRMAFTIE